MSDELEGPVTYDLSRKRAYSLNAAHEPGPVEYPSLQQQKESAARLIALLITWTFVGTAAVVLAGAFCILLLRTSDAKTLLLDTAMPFLEKTGVFLSSTFGPLLAFVLGYYFGEKAKTGAS